jgi:hypothetical protein
VVRESTPVGQIAICKRSTTDSVWFCLQLPQGPCLGNGGVQGHLGLVGACLRFVFALSLLGAEVCGMILEVSSGSVYATTCRKPMSEHRSGHLCRIVGKTFDCTLQRQPRREIPKLTARLCHCCSVSAFQFASAAGEDPPHTAQQETRQISAPSHL